MANIAPLKIDIVVHGRFFSFSLAHALIKRGHDVLVHTNYPSFAAKPWQLPKSAVDSFALHGIADRIGNRIAPAFWASQAEAARHRSFGRWAARRVRPDADVVLGFSGVMEEYLYSTPRRNRQLRLLARGSAHIREQARILREEEERVRHPVPRPSAFILAREEREYELADSVLVLSTFARRTFIEQGVDPDKVILLRPGVDLRLFRPSEQALAARRHRIGSGASLRILTAGTFSSQKGAFDYAEAAGALGGRMHFRFVGDRPGETISLQRRLVDHVEFIPRVPERRLGGHYEWADLFFFPTLQDGFAVVLAQAAAEGLPILTTVNSGGADLIEDGRTGWVLPIRSSAAFIDRLEWCDSHRSELARMVSDTAFRHRTWDDMAADFAQFCQAALSSAEPSRAIAGPGRH